MHPRTLTAHSFAGSTSLDFTIFKAAIRACPLLAELKLPTY
jgi:hypothetical protein